MGTAVVKTSRELHERFTRFLAAVPEISIVGQPRWSEVDGAYVFFLTSVMFPETWVAQAVEFRFYDSIPAGAFSAVAETGRMRAEVPLGRFEQANGGSEFVRLAPVELEGRTV